MSSAGAAMAGGPPAPPRPRPGAARRRARPPPPRARRAGAAGGGGGDAGHTGGAGLGDDFAEGFRAGGEAREVGRREHGLDVGARAGHAYAPAEGLRETTVVRQALVVADQDERGVGRRRL